MLKIALGAEFNSEKMFKDVAALASQYKGVQLHTHVAENPVGLWHALKFFVIWGWHVILCVTMCLPDCLIVCMTMRAALFLDAILLLKLLQMHDDLQLGLFSWSCLYAALM